MKNQLRYVVMDLKADQGIPKTIKIVPLGNVSSQKGDFVVDKESFELIKNGIENHGVDVVIDYEHQTLKDIQAPAAGWVKTIALTEDAIVATVDWTKQGQEYVANKEYRYLSPVIMVRKSDRKACRLHSIGLTNTPAIDGMFPIINSMTIEEDGDEGANKMELSVLAKLLGLGEDATEEQVTEAIKALIEAGKNKQDEKQEDVVANKTILDLLSLKEDAKTEDVAAAISALQNQGDQVSKAEFMALKEKLEQRDADDLVMQAMKAGKVAPAQKEWAEAYALKDPQGFKDFVEKAPAVVPVGELNFETKANKGRMTEDEIKVCKSLGLDEDEVKKYAE